MSVYMFDLGNSNKGAIGAVIEVEAQTKVGALIVARRLAAEAQDHPIMMTTQDGQVRVYLNPGRIQYAAGWCEER